MCILSGSAVCIVFKSPVSCISTVVPLCGTGTIAFSCRILLSIYFLMNLLRSSRMKDLPLPVLVLMKAPRLIRQDVSSKRPPLHARCNGEHCCMSRACTLAHFFISSEASSCLDWTWRRPPPHTQCRGVLMPQSTAITSAPCSMRKTETSTFATLHDQWRDVRP